MRIQRFWRGVHAILLLCLSQFCTKLTIFPNKKEGGFQPRWVRYCSVVVIHYTLPPPDFPARRRLFNKKTPDQTTASGSFTLKTYYNGLANSAGFKFVHYTRNKSDRIGYILIRICWWIKIMMYHSITILVRGHDLKQTEVKS